MKLRSIAALAVLFAMALSVAVGAPKNKKTINLTDPTRVGTVVLQPGDYTIEWTGTGSDVQVSFTRQEHACDRSSNTRAGAESHRSHIRLRHRAVRRTFPFED